MTATTLPTTEPRIARRLRAAAVARDAAPLLVGLAIAVTVTTSWLLVRTEAGLLRVQDADARRAAAIVLAVPPAWAAWLAPGVAHGATSGQRRAGLQVQGGPLARLARTAIHPLSLPLWGWLALLAAASGLPWPAILFGFMATFTGLLAFGSTALWVALPTSRALHDRVARTRLTLATGEERRS
ncbi:MAG: hypothetical protein EXR66_08670 [Dehalococcoidia bacterium]|nr:hypothetical protein [Dehalococcoidia bacterium]